MVPPGYVIDESRVPRDSGHKAEIESVIETNS